MKKYQIPEDQRNLVAAVRSAAIVLLVGFLGYLADPVAILNAFFPIMVLAIALGGSVPKLQHFWHKNYPEYCCHWLLYVQLLVSMLDIAAIRIQLCMAM